MVGSKGGQSEGEEGQCWVRVGWEEGREGRGARKGERGTYAMKSEWISVSEERVVSEGSMKRMPGMN